MTHPRVLNRCRTCQGLDVQSADALLQLNEPFQPWRGPTHNKNCAPQPSNSKHGRQHTTACWACAQHSSEAYRQYTRQYNQCTGVQTYTYKHNTRKPAVHDAVPCTRRHTACAVQRVTSTRTNAPSQTPHSDQVVFQCRAGCHTHALLGAATAATTAAAAAACLEPLLQLLPSSHAACEVDHILEGKDLAEPHSGLCRPLS